MPPNDATGLPTGRELQALELLANGISRPDIGTKLRVKTSSVNAYIAQASTKLGANDTSLAIFWACSSGLIPLAFGRVSVPGVPFRELVNIAGTLQTATAMDLPALQGRATPTLAALTTQNTPTWALCNRSTGLLRPL